MDLSKPEALAHPAGGAGVGGKTASTALAGTGGASTGSNSNTSTGSAGATGTGGGTETGGSSGGSIVDAGATGGTTVPSSGAPDAAGGNTEIDASASLDLPPATGGLASDGGPGGSGGSTGARPDAAADVRVTDAGGAGDTGTGGTGGRDGGLDAAGAEVRDAAAPSPDAAPDACVLCAIGTTLIHRYDFNGTGTKVTDSVGTAHGEVKNTTLSGSGTLVLAGGTTDQYVDLPDRLLSPLTSATLEIWVTWSGGNNNQRILDFGNNEQVSGSYRAITTVIISPNSAPDGTARLRTSYSHDVSAASTFVDATSTLPTGSIQQVVAVFDGPNKTLAMYLNGALVSQTTGLEALALINDTNVMLGKSQYSGDPGFAGTYYEFRIYNAPLTAAQVQAVYAAGTTASFSH